MSDSSKRMGCKIRWRIGIDKK